MYLSFYRLHDAPFNITPDPAFLYWTPGHQEAYAALTYGVDAQKGFIALIGEVGCGKTTVLRSYLEQADPERVKAIYLVNPEQNFDDVLRTMLNELGIAIPDGGTPLAVEALHQYLLDSHKADRRVVLIVDEAQRMPAETMERLRVLSNLETAKAKLLQIVLCGQPELETLLARDDLRQIRERIAVRAHIGPLTPTQSLACIRHRVVCAGGSADQLFSRGALKEIVRRIKGNPRLLNVLCDNALITGFANRERPVKVRTIQNASEVIGQQREHGSRKRLALAAASLCLVAGLGFAGITAKNWLPSPIGNPLTTANTVVQPPVTPAVPEPALKEARTADSTNVVPPAVAATESVQNATTESKTPQQMPVETAVEETPNVVTASVPGADMPPPPPVTPPVESNAVSPEPIATVPTVAPVEPASAPSPTVAEAVPTEPVIAANPEVTEAKPSPPEAAAVEPNPAPAVTKAQEAPVEITTAKPETADSAEQQQAWVTVVPGDNIRKLVKRLNGRAHPDLVKSTLALNPDITDADLIHPGQRVAIPIVPNDPSEAAGRENSAPNAKE